MKTMRNLGMALATWLAACSTASADGQQPKESCFGMRSTDHGTLQAGRISKTGAAINFPYSADAVGEKFKAGALVVVSQIEGGYACVQSGTHGRNGAGPSGWIPAGDVRILSADQSRPATGWWVGFWKHGASTILFQTRDSRLWASGSSRWQGFGDPHFGEFGGHPFPSRGAFKISDDDASPGLDDFSDGCMVEMIALGDHMAVEDNSQCGGMNVRFFGIYTRVHARRSAKH